MCPMFRVWLQTDAVELTFTPALTTTMTKVVPRDPMRFCIVLAASSATAVAYDITGRPNANGIYVVNTSYTPVIVRDEDIGGQVCEPIWAWLASGTGPGFIRTYSYTGAKFDVYQRYIRSILSKLGSP